MSKLDIPQLEITYNLPQLLLMQAPQKVKCFEGSRGIGKSTIIAGDMRKKVVHLPRSANVIVGETYQQILTRTLPSTIQGLEMHGFIKDVHYVVGKKPPRKWNWKEPYQPPLKYDYFICFWNGTGWHLVSQDRPGTGRGLNADSVTGDEAALLDKAKLDQDVLATNRGNIKNFGENNPYHHTELYTTTTPLTVTGQWIFDIEKLANEQPKKYFFLSADATFNIENLGAEWFVRMKEMMLPQLYDAEILNIRVSTIEKSFYPLLKPHHSDNYFDYAFYDSQEPDQVKADCRGDLDLNRDSAIIAGMDFGDAINCLVTCQHHEDTNTLHYLKDFFVKNPKILEDLADKFASYYHHHRKKILYLHYDVHGNKGVANSKLTYAQQFKQALEQQGWKVILMTASTGRNPQHMRKFLLWNKLLQENDHRLPRVRFNKSNCKTLLISMRNAQTRQSSNDMISKDKRPEQSKKGLREHKTDLSDAADYVLFGLFQKYLDRFGSVFYDTRIGG